MKNVLWKNMFIFSNQRMQKNTHGNFTLGEKKKETISHKHTHTHTNTHTHVKVNHKLKMWRVKIRWKTLGWHCGFSGYIFGYPFGIWTMRILHSTNRTQ